MSKAGPSPIQDIADAFADGNDGLVAVLLAKHGAE